MDYEEAQKLYEDIDRLFSPVFNDFIYFTTHGFEHLIFKNSRRKRKESEQQLRFSLLSLGVKLIGLSTTYQEFEERNNRGSIYYWGIIAILDKKKIKVVIRKIGINGLFHFWSIFPVWETSKQRDKKFFKKIKNRKKNL
jgi:hypothetical protein